MFGKSKTEPSSEVPTAAKRRMPKSLRNALISCGVLLVLLLGAGAAYTWWAGQQPVQTVETVQPTVPDGPAIKPPQISPDAKESAAVEALTTPIAPGSNASITVKTNPLSDCTITVVYGTVASKDSGLGPKKADVYGTISWTWTVEKTAPLGKWPVKVTCVYHTRSAVVQGDLEVTNTPPSGS